VASLDLAAIAEKEAWAKAWTEPGALMRGDE
jgi:hypothetical protein